MDVRRNHYKIFCNRERKAALSVSHILDFMVVLNMKMQPSANIKTLEDVIFFSVVLGHELSKFSIARFQSVPI